MIILLSFAICAENVRIKIGNAQSTNELLSRGSIISQFATEELEDSVLIEEKVSSDGEAVKNEQNDFANINSFAVKQGGQIGTSSEEFAEEFLSARILAHSEGLVKPDITSTTFAQESKTPERKEVEEYIVQAGDVVGLIAAKFGISVNTILWSNNLVHNSIIRPGDKLKILPVNGVLHKVAYGETLGAIAKKYNAELEKIKEYNILANANSLQKGQELIIPDGVMKMASQIAASRNSQYRAPIASSISQYSSSANFVWPTTSKRITQYYHWGHHAIDVGGKTGTPIYSIEKGQVIFSGWSSGYGYNIIIDHGGGQKSRYAHFSNLYVKKGTLVDKGQKIGEMGSTGWSTGPHLHLEIIINGVKVNPLKYVK